MAVRVLTPGVWPNVQLPTVAIPSDPDDTFEPVIDPPPEVTANVTGTPPTGLPEASFTITEGSSPT